MTTFALEVIGLHAWQHGQQVLHDIDLRVRPGEIVAVVGESDHGPQALLQAIQGLCSARMGSIRLPGAEAIHLPPPHIRQLGVAHCDLWAGDLDHDDLSCEEQLLLPALDDPPLGGGLSLADLYDTFPALASHRHAATAELPTQARLLLPIARALRHGADLLLVSVPSAPLRHADTLAQLLPCIRRALTSRSHALLLACSQPSLAQLADQQIHMRAGRVLPTAGIRLPA